MRFPTPLRPALLLRRYKRFLADLQLEDGSVVTAHCANPGSMLGLAEPGRQVWLSAATNPARKLGWSWELVASDGSGQTLVNVQTNHANLIAAEAIAAGQIAELTGYARLRREVRYGQSSRIDLLLEDDARPPCYVEVKSVTLRLGDLACFPDAVTARGSKHLRELMDVVAAGQRAVMLFLVQRGDCLGFAPAEQIDPLYAQTLRKAAAAGVEILCYACQISRYEILLDQPVPVLLDQPFRP